MTRDNEIPCQDVKKLGFFSGHLTMRNGGVRIYTSVAVNGEGLCQLVFGQEGCQF